MANLPLIVRRLSAPICGLALTWFVTRIPGEYAYASVWLMPTVAAFFAFATWFAFAYRGMDQWMASARKPLGSDQQRSEYPYMATICDFAGRVCIGVGVLSALIQKIYSPTHCSWELPLAVGLGISIGANALAKVKI